MEGKKGIIFTGAIVGIIAVSLVKFGNPLNMGFCIACFIRDIAGGLGLHRAAVVQYLRPEIMGLVLGAFIMALSKKEFSSRGGSSPFIRFILGMTVMIGALMFLGCPLRMVLRLGGGDLNAIVGIAGFAVGIALGIFFLNKGFSLKRNYKLSKAEGFVFPIINILFIILLLSAPTFIFFSEKGPGSMHAPIFISLASGLIVGALAQRTRLCMVGGIRDLFLFKDTYLLSGFIAIFVFALIGNIGLGYFKIGFLGQPVAHADGIWNFLGMILCGFSSVLLGGCPMRQLILAGEGNTDSVITVIGMLVGAAFSHNFGLAASPKGPTLNGQIAVVICLIVVGFIGYFNSEILSNEHEVKGEVKVG
ncbi:YedE-related selenium metabolism membrane protein [Crassaminicella thermophila]|uniref:YedE-related selenium metabolism membrane protein n=1 Tax=Crassaminicella thermophila TaxID=2599308 RepID=A0A5C0SGX4_CRATE|nr:YedE family putative selenium transporter [Crassaminicella thermophila]QEK13440.1 YedE-related selenium metabolism membrane protein [Crassaminicella thermophila]